MLNFIAALLNLDLSWPAVRLQSLICEMDYDETGIAGYEHMFDDFDMDDADDDDDDDYGVLHGAPLTSFPDFCWNVIQQIWLNIVISLALCVAFRIAVIVFRRHFAPNQGSSIGKLPVSVVFSLISIVYVTS